MANGIKHPLSITTALLLALAVTGCSWLRDDRVVVSATAMPDYTASKYHVSATQRETYVIMPGHYFAGLVADSSLDRMTIQQLAESLAPELAHQNYLPATSLKSADLVLVVHWGVTAPRLTSNQLRGVTTISLDDSLEKQAEQERAGRGGAEVAAAMSVSESDRRLQFEETERLTDDLEADFHASDVAQLLGYARDLRRLSRNPISSEEEITLRKDFTTERYFVIIHAYDLHQVVSGKPKRVWTLHLNMRSPGHNFGEAVVMMSEMVPAFAGRETDHVQTTLPKLREGTVTVGDIKIIGETK